MSINVQVRLLICGLFFLGASVNRASALEGLKRPCTISCLTGRVDIETCTCKDDGESASSKYKCSFDCPEESYLDTKECRCLPR